MDTRETQGLPVDPTQPEAAAPAPEATAPETKKSFLTGWAESLGKMFGGPKIQTPEKPPEVGPGTIPNVPESMQGAPLGSDVVKNAIVESTDAGVTPNLKELTPDSGAPTEAPPPTPIAIPATPAPEADAPPEATPATPDPLPLPTTPAPTTTEAATPAAVGTPAEVTPTATPAEDKPVVLTNS